MNFSTRSLYFPAAAFAAALAFAPLANAGLVVVNANTTVQGSANPPPATTGISTIDLTGKVGSTNFNINSGSSAVNVATTQNGAIVQGSLSNAYSAPVLNSSGAVVTTPYFSTGGTPGFITLTFTSMQSYLGLLWGSIGTGDYMSFYNGSTLIATVTGTNAIAAATGYNGANGARDFGGSQYTLVNFLNGATFNQVVMGQSGGPSFESANFQYAARNVAAVPEPGAVALLGIGLAGLVAARRRKAARV